MDLCAVDAEEGVIAGEFGAVGGFEIDGHGFLEGKNFEAQVAGGDLGRVAAEADFEDAAVIEIIIEQAAVEREAGDITFVVDAEDGVRGHVQVGGESGLPDGGGVESVFSGRDGQGEFGIVGFPVAQGFGIFEKFQSDGRGVNDGLGIKDEASMKRISPTHSHI